MSSVFSKLHGDGDAAGSSTKILSSILNDIGAPELLQRFVDDDQLDENIPLLGKLRPVRIEKKYGLSQDQASAFVRQCLEHAGSQHTSASAEVMFPLSSVKPSLSPSPAAAASASPVDDASLLLKFNLEFICQLTNSAWGSRVHKCKHLTNAASKRLHFVAVKLITNPEYVCAFMRNLPDAEHKNIVRIYKIHDLTSIFGIGTSALEMELVSGGDLSEHLESCRRCGQRLPCDAVLRFSRQLLSTLVYLHDEMKWLHGDIKPQNMLMQCSPVPADGSAVDYSSAEIKLTGFDFAKVMDEQDHLLAGQLIGTVWYLTPEALQSTGNGKCVYERTCSDDLWSACLVIFEMDTGLPLQQLMTAPGAVKLDELRTKASPELMPLLYSVLAVPDAVSRCQSAAELLRKLDASIDPLFVWQCYDKNKYVSVHPASSYALEEAFAADRPMTMLPLQPPLDLNFDIKALLSSSTALGYQTGRSSGAKCPIRRLLKSSALTSSASIPIWQELVEGKEWLQCSPALCAKLQIDSSNPSAAPDATIYRRIVLQPGSIGSAQLPFAMKSKPYCEPAPAAEIAILNMRVHDSLPEWDITDMVQVVNSALSSKYAGYRHRVAAHCNGNPNERMMFHYAHPYMMTKIWQEGEGHDPRLSNWAEIGKGAYFSKHVMYDYAYIYSLFPVPPNYEVKPEPPIGASMKVFASLVCLGNTADMGPGCETCPSPAWDAWKKELPILPKPTRPPAMALPNDAAEKQHILDLMKINGTPRYDSVSSTEGEIGTHPASTNMDTSGRRIGDIMHPRLKARAKEWGEQYVLFESAASYPMFIATLTKTRESPSSSHVIFLNRDNMIWNEISGHYVSLSDAVPRLSTLEILHIYCNAIGDSGCSALSKALLHFPSLQELHLQGNNVGNSGCSELAEALPYLSALQVLHLSNNVIDVVGVCRLVPSLLNKPQLSVVSLDHNPFSCVGLDLWQQTGLHLPPAEVLRKGWVAVLQYLGAGPKVPVHELRLMLIGDGEVGKTSLQRAFQDKGKKAEWIGKQERTVGINISELLFESQHSPQIKCQVCDCAGQEIYYFSHTMHFTRRCLYVLTWTSHKFSENRVVQELTLDDIVSPLIHWLQLLAANVPEACVLLVGTHCLVEPDRFAAIKIQVEQQVQAEMKRLQNIAVAEGASTRLLLKRQQARGLTLLRQITLDPSFSQLGLHAPLMQLKIVHAFEQHLHRLMPVPKRSLRRKAKQLLQTMQELTRTQERLCRMHALYDGSVPADNAPLAHLKLVNDFSFTVDSIEGFGVEELLVAIEATCRDSQALPFMGECVPQSWLQVRDALQEQQQQQRLGQAHHQSQDYIGSRVMSLDDAVSNVRTLLQTQFQVDVKLARQLDITGVQSSLEFWSLLGRVFVYDGHFLREPRIVVDLLKPLVHHDVLNESLHDDGYRQQCLANPTDFSSDHLLKLLQKDAVLDHRLLPHLAAWAPSSKEAHASILKFLEGTFMISAINAFITSENGGNAELQRSLVTARLFDNSDGDRQREVDALSNDILTCGIFHALYVLPSAHVGIISHMMATVQSLQPRKNALAFRFARDGVCLLRLPSRCAISLRPLSRVFASELGSIRFELPPGRFSHAIVISSNDDGLFAFAARCVDAMMQSGKFGSQYQCWLPYRSSAADGSWRPLQEDWAELSSPENVKSLSEVLSANSSDVVVPSMNLRLRDVLPRRPRVFMSHTYSGDGTGECCQRIKDGLQERLLCTVWFDKKEMSWADAFIDEMKRGMANASAFLICLSPLYLTRPNCLRELMWAMDMCAADKTKKLCVLPMHPSVSFAGCRAIVKLAAAGCAAQVILPVDDRCKDALTQLKQLKGHKLSDIAVTLLRRLSGSQNVGINAEWLKLQPWRSDAEGEDWEETSQPWAGPCEGKTVELQGLLENLSLDVQVAVNAAVPAYNVFAFTDVEDNELESLPPSQDYQSLPDTALLRSTFPHLLRNFSEAEAVQLMLLGLRDADAVDCIAHGFMRDSKSLPSQPNPVDQVFRMAAHMSGCFSPRSRSFTTQVTATCTCVCM